MNQYNEYFEKFLTMMESSPYLKSFILTICLFIFFSIARVLILNTINKKSMPRHEKVLLKRRISQYMFYLFLFLTFVLWFTQLQVVFVSLLAVAAAVVLAFKELIMCITGGSLINLSHIFREGHRIEVDGLRGFVVEKNLLTTKILEIGPEKNSQQTTGDIIAIPNSLMLSKSVKNESYFKGYSIKSFIFKIADESKIADFEQQVLSIAEAFCEHYLEEAKKHIHKFCEKEGLIVPSISPKTKIIVEEGKDFSVLIKLPIRNTEIADIEQKLNRFYLEWRIQNK